MGAIQIHRTLTTYIARPAVTRGNGRAFFVSFVLH